MIFDALELRRSSVAVFLPVISICSTRFGTSPGGVAGGGAASGADSTVVGAAGVGDWAAVSVGYTKADAMASEITRWKNGGMKYNGK